MRAHLGGVPHAPGEAVGRALDRRTSSTSASLHRFSGPLRGPSQCAPTLNQPNNYDDDGQHEENVDEPADGGPGYESDGPQDQQYHGDGPQHVTHLP